MQIGTSNHLTIGGVDVVELATLSPYPLYILDEKLIRMKMRAYLTSVKKYYPEHGEVFYASKALINLALCKIAEQEGIGLDVASIGELFTAIQAKFPMKKVIMHGNNKSYEELELAVKNNIGRIVIDNFDDIRMLSALTESLNQTVNVLIRIKPDVRVHTHTYIETGDKESKFGFDISVAQEAIKSILKCNKLLFRGLHIHIGSQILEINAYKKAIDAVTLLIKNLYTSNISIEECNLGGGLGIAYTDNDEKIDIENFIKDIATYLISAFQYHELSLPTLLLEPGRSIIGEAGTTIYHIGSIKEMPGNRFYVAVNGGMNDNIRPSLYSAKYSAVLANRIQEEGICDCRIVGKLCESGDVLIDRILLPKPRRGDILAVLSTGAYNYSMASNYNRLPIPGMALTYNGNVDWIVKPQALEDMIRNDLIPERLR
ncbi:Diaminopimelate decarboxylase [Alphaproteobacteria bacterium]